jgi:hypothetical protein
MTTSFNTRAATMSQLLTFFNANTGGAQVKKFADRPTAEKRVQKLVDEMAAEEFEPAEVAFFAAQRAVELAHPDNIAAAEREIATRQAEGEDMSDATIDPVTSAIVNHSAANTRIAAMLAAEVSGDACPNCGATQDITSGRVINRFGHQVLVDEGLFTCHSCSHEWGAADKAPKAAAAYRTVRNNMVTSLKLDRRIVHTDTGSIYANACQVWKAGLVSASQGDRLSSVLYTAAKNNDRVVTVVNGHTFRLFA